MTLQVLILPNSGLWFRVQGIGFKGLGVQGICRPLLIELRRKEGRAAEWPVAAELVVTWDLVVSRDGLDPM